MKIYLFLLVGIMLAGLVSAEPPSLNAPTGMVVEKYYNSYNVTESANFTNVAFTNRSEDWGSNNVSASWFDGFLDWSNLQDIPAYVKDWASDISDAIDDALENYYNTTQIDSLFVSVGNWSADKSSYSNTSADYTNDTASFVARNNWTTIDNYPSACGAGEYASAIGDTLTCSAPSVTLSWQPVYLANDVTCNSASAFSSVFVIPLTENKMNIITGHLPTKSAKSGTAPQIGFNMTGASSTSNGTCYVVTSLTATTQEVDYLKPIAGAVVDTATTAWIDVNYNDIPFTCDIDVVSGDTAYLNVWLADEGTDVVTIRAGAYYQKFVN